MCHFVRLNPNRFVLVTGSTASWCTQCVVSRGYHLWTGQPHPGSHKNKTKHGYTTVTGLSTSKIQAAEQWKLRAKWDFVSILEGFCAFETVFFRKRSQENTEQIEFFLSKDGNYSSYYEVQKNNNKRAALVWWECWWFGKISVELVPVDPPLMLLFGWLGGTGSQTVWLVTM